MTRTKTRTTTRTLLTWVVGPLAVALLTGAIAHRRTVGRYGVFQAATAALPAGELQALEGAPALAVANATWALGSVQAVRDMTRIELDRLPESDPLRRARVFLRCGIIDTNFDGQAALFGQACVADAGMCSPEQLKAVASREIQARFVASANALPLYVTGHPSDAGPR